MGILPATPSALSPVSAVPVLLDGDHHIPAGQRTLHRLAAAQLRAVLDLAPDTGARQISVRRDGVRDVVVEHHVHLDLLDHHLAVLWRAGGLCAVTAQFPVCRRARHDDLHHLSGASDAALHSAVGDHPQLQFGGHALGADPHLPDVPHPVLHVVDDGLLQGHPERARGMRPHRWRLALEGDALHHHPRRRARHSVGRHLRLHAVVERVHLRPRVPLLAGAENRARRRRLRTHSRRRVLLGRADGRRLAGQYSRRDRLLVLR